MAISDGLFLAILSMDAYNRGYASGIEVQGQPLGVGGQIGNPTIINENRSAPAQNAIEFYKHQRRRRLG